MKTALVTGVAGFIGSHVADHCLRSGLRVVGVDDLSGGIIANVPGEVSFQKGSVTDPDFVKAVFAEFKPDYIYHLAAYAAEGLSHFIRRYNYETNLVGSINLINQAILTEVKCFVFTSSIAVYGSLPPPMHEGQTPHPEDPYGISKYAVELDLKAARMLFGLPYVIFRPHNVYGERQNCADKYRNVLGIFMNQVVNNKPMSVFGDGLQTRAFSHVDDVAPLIAMAPFVPAAQNEVFNVGADRPYTVLDLAHLVARAFGVKAEITHLPAREEVIHAFGQHDKANRVFQPKPAIPIEEGVERMAHWVRKHGVGTPVDFSAIEVEKKLPLSWRRQQ